MTANADITVWNRFVKGGKEYFKPTHIKNVACFAKEKNKATQIGKSPVNGLIVRIPENALIENGRFFVSAAKYNPFIKKDCWTLALGDFITFGGHLNEDELPKGRKHQIYAVNDNRDLRLSLNARHWKIEAK